MSLTAQWNLSASNRLSIFSVSDNKHLILRTWDENNPGQKGVPTDPSDIDDGPIVEGSSIAAVTLQDWTRVFGWANAKKSKCTPDNYLYMLSPVPQWINQVATSSTKTALAAIGTGPTSWIYYINKNTEIYELNYSGVGTGKTSGTKVNGGGKPHKHSKLAAALSYGVNDRLVAYQQENKKIQVYNNSSSTGHELKKSFAFEGTPLALISYKTAAGIVVSVYYLSDDDVPVLQRSDSVNEGPWNTETVNIQSGAPSKATTLSAIWSNNLQAVVLTFKDDSGQVTTQKDAK